MGQVTYSIEKSDGTKIDNRTIYECFAKINSSYNTYPTDCKFTYHLEPHSSLTEEEINFWWENCNSLGFISNRGEGEFKNDFSLINPGKYIKLLSTFCILRYASQNEGLKDFVKWIFDKKKKFPKISFLSLFQLAHFVNKIANSNHTFFAGYNIYSANSPKKVSKNVILRNLDDIQNTKGYGAGLDSVFIDRDNKERLTQEISSKINELLKADKIKEANNLFSKSSIKAAVVADKA